MAVFTITSATSIFSVGTVGFQDGSGAADALTVQNGAHVIASEGMLPGSGDNAIWLKGPGAWTATINGNVLSTHKTGLLLESGLPLSTIDIGANGSITGAFAAIEARSAVTHHQPRSAEPDRNRRRVGGTAIFRLGRPPTDQLRDDIHRLHDSLYTLRRRRCGDRNHR